MCAAAAASVAAAAGLVITQPLCAKIGSAAYTHTWRRVIVRVTGGGGGGSGKRASERAHTSAGDPALVARTAWSAHIIGSGGGGSGGFSRFRASKAHPDGGGCVHATAREARAARTPSTQRPTRPTRVRCPATNHPAKCDRGWRGRRAPSTPGLPVAAVARGSSPLRLRGRALRTPRHRY